ncbi:16S rRNA (uracil(1498)-N(3))-methyltransferase [Candidatus Chloroploca sp. Khr17]|uniref:16S rRNA (uracil(1498)-N(3))-methyltransferase n=1 Tax=Candidatus Chloroploca sp. Khr17 TaxID=2496869 RepID=UPI00101D3E16|nr:16S rRNA (uracil(1498)-N(3))-methyltransferase [Candidatus Chloroploca sp. Khr17]
MKNTFRFFVEPATVHSDLVRLEDPALAHQLSRVLRLNPGDQILLLDGLGTAYTLELTALSRKEVVGHILAHEQATGEPDLHLTIYLPLIRAERFEWALQKCVELGASRFVPVLCTRSLASERADQRKHERWQRIVREAAEQACRGVLPIIEPPQTFASACTQVHQVSLALLLAEFDGMPLLRTILRTYLTTTNSPSPTSLALFSGPEGGLTPDELTTAVDHGIMPVSLGPRILRAETAPVAATAALLYELDNRSAVT